MSAQCAQVLKDYYFGENGVSVPSDDELQKYFDDNYITAKHILILTESVHRRDHPHR